ncbi:MAG: VWA domain-containing protein [Holophagales bacterium]|nr:VWA domain-containing protein [Holophagales bacterium]MYF95605.1 VWA domain-containing protein [Holophagales bacterium]
MISTCSRHRLLPAVVALLAVLSPAAAAGQVLSRDAEIILQAPGSESLQLSIDDVELLENGSPRDVTAVDRVRDRWRILIYFDLTGSTPRGVEAAGTAIRDSADSLVALGDVEIVTADRIPEVLLEPTGAAEEVRAAAEEVMVRASEAGALLNQRRNLEAASESGPGGLRAADLLEGFHLELDTLSWQRANLLEALEGGSWFGGPPRVLFLVRNATDLNASAFIQRRLGEPTPAFERAARAEQRRQKGLARAVAALGWRVYPLHAATSDGIVDGLLPGRLESSEAFANASGGRVLTDLEDIQSTLALLRSSWRVHYRSAGARDGASHPVDLRLHPSAAPRTPPPELSARRWATSAAPRDLLALRAARALEAFAGEEPDPAAAGTRELAVRGTLLLQGVARDARGAPAELVTVDGVATVSDMPPAASDALRITIYGRGLDVPPFLLHRSGAGAALERGAWRFRTHFDLPVEIDELVLMVEDLRNDRWRVAVLETGSTPLDDRSEVELLAPDPAQQALAAHPAQSQGGVAGHLVPRRGRPRLGSLAPGTRSASGRPPADNTVIRLLPPRGVRSGLRGKQSFTTVTTTDAVRRVTFYLDDRQVFEDSRKPFDATIDLGPEIEPHTLRISAYDRSNRRLGGDELQINQPLRSAGVAIAAVEPRPDGSYEIEARLDLAGDWVLDRVEFYRNDRLVATMTRPPFRTVLPGPAMPGADFARVAMYLDDGAMLEDVEFLTTDTAVAETVVNLVEVYVVVNDENGKPVDTLSREDFVLRTGRREIAVERFAVAEEVPLVLGLAIDSSESMYTLMPETRRAAARFLGGVLTEIDQAFLVDFNNRPRLLADTTADVASLIDRLAAIRADGSTALYDAMQFSLVHLASDQGRRALVVLTDGDDSGSQSGYRRTFRAAGNTGVPIYVISMSHGIGPSARSHRKLDLEGITETSGGRVFYVSGMEAVLSAYERIGEELRSQYMLGYTTDAPLSPKEVQSLTVELRSGKARNGEVRMTIGRGRG